MLGLFRAIRFSLAVIAAAVTLAAGLSSSHAETGLVAVTVTKAGFIVGGGGGSGTLRFQKRSYPLSISGISIGATIGASRTELLGRAYNINDPRDIVGSYTAVGAGVALASGAGEIRLQNSKGVILVLKGRKVGLEYSISLSGLEISMR